MSNTVAKIYSDLSVIDSAFDLTELSFICNFHDKRYAEHTVKKHKSLIKAQFKQDMFNILKALPKSALKEMAFKQEWNLIFEEAWLQGIKTNVTEVGFILWSKLKV